MITLPEKHIVLVVDDEPDVHILTRLTLKGMKFQGREVEILTASTGTEAIEKMRAHPEISVVLMDVVMESRSAGLDAANKIRNELKNTFVRILVRTGQAGAAPERKVVEEYDIDGYLSKAELTSDRLYSAIRTGIKAYEELIELQRHRELITLISDSVSSLHAFDPLEETLHRILETAIQITPTSLAILKLETFGKEGDPCHHLIHLSKLEPEETKEKVASITEEITKDPAARSLKEGGSFGGGYLLPIVLHRDLGYGWIYFAEPISDLAVLQVLPLLTSHAGNALYSTIALEMLKDREGPFYESIPI